MKTTKETVKIRKNGRIRIHVNQHVIRKNLKYKCNEPMITIKAGKRNVYCHEVELSPGTVLVSQNNPLSCGARVWLEAPDQVVAITYPYKECKKEKRAISSDG